MATSHSPLGPTELDVLRFVAENHPARVAEVAKRLAEVSGQARTTVLTTLERLRRKRYLTRRKIDGAWHYSPAKSQAGVLVRLVGEFVERALRGSVAPFVAYLAEADDLTDEELSLLKARVEELERRRKGANND